MRWAMNDIVPTFTTPKALAKRLTASPRFVCDTVRELGCFCKIGQKVIMLDHHVVAFMEAMECHSRSSSEINAEIRRKDSDWRIKVPPPSESCLSNAAIDLTAGQELESSIWISTCKDNRILSH